MKSAIRRLAAASFRGACELYGNGARQSFVVEGRSYLRKC